MKRAAAASAGTARHFLEVRCGGSVASRFFCARETAGKGGPPAPNFQFHHQQMSIIQKKCLINHQQLLNKYYLLYLFSLHQYQSSKFLFRQRLFLSNQVLDLIQHLRLLRQRHLFQCCGTSALYNGYRSVDWRRRWQRDRGLDVQLADHLTLTAADFTF